MSLLKHLRSGGEWTAFQLIKWLALGLGLDRASWFSGWLWRKIARFNRRQDRARRHIRASMPQLRPDEVEQLLSAMWDNLGRTMVEGFFLERIIRDPARSKVTPEFEGFMQRAHQEGAVFISGHMGNWELGVPLLWSRNLEVGGIYRHVESNVIDQAVLGLRSKFYRAGLWRKAGVAARNAMKLAERKKVVALLCDLRDPAGASVPYFGRLAPSTTFPALLARERGVPMFFAKMRRDNGAYFTLHAVEITYAWSDDRAADLEAVTRLIQAQMEAFVRETPAQWMWAHRRWTARDSDPEQLVEVAVHRHPGRTS